MPNANSYETFCKENEALSNVRPAEFVFEVPLYEKVKIEGAALVRSMFSDGLSRVDGHCVECERDSVFHSLSVYPTEVIAGGYKRSSLLQIEYSCQRINTHKIVLFSSVEWVSYYRSRGNPSTITEQLIAVCEKVGQTPSHADIANGDLAAFRSVLDQIDRKEFIRANGLAAHGVNIGAFVYLRRVFERLLERARQRAGAEIDQTKFSNAKVSEKISLLADYLPDFMVKNGRVYSVLSKGIHELGEADCARYYVLVRDSCLLMLEQEKDLFERRKMEENLSKSIANTQLPSGGD